MKKNWMIAGLMATVIMVATFGAVIAAEDTGETADAGIVDFDETTDGDVNYLITKAQMGEINDEKRAMIREF